MMNIKSKIKNHPEKFREFPGLSPRNLSKIPEGKLKIVEEKENNFLNPQELSFYLSEGEKLGLKIKNKLTYQEVQPVSLFPFTHPHQFISLKDEKGKEIGIIKDLKDLSKEGKNLLKQELARRYLIPVIKDIVYIKEEFGNYHWEVITDRGRKEFYVKGRSENLSFVNEGQIILTDIENCRYQIRDWHKLPRKARVELEKVI